MTVMQGDVELWICLFYSQNAFHFSYNNDCDRIVHDAES